MKRSMKSLNFNNNGKVKLVVNSNYHNNWNSDIKV